MTTSRSNQSPRASHTSTPASAVARRRAPVRARPSKLLPYFSLLTILALLLGVLGAPVAVAAPLSADLPLGCLEQVQNGGFEELNAAWTVTPSPNPGTYDNVQVFAGEYAMRLGNLDAPNVPSESLVSQTINLPANANSIILSFRYYGQADGENGTGDFQFLDIYDAGSNTFLQRRFQVTNSDQMWLGAQYSITDLRGRDVRLVFGVTNDGQNGRLAMFLDEVSVVYCNSTPTPPGTATNTPTATPTSTFVATFAPTLFPTLFPTPVPTMQPTMLPTIGVTIIPTLFPTPVPPVVQPTAALPTALPPDAACTDLMVNGSFEANTAWEFGQTPLVGMFTSAVRFDGNRSAQLGNPLDYRSDTVSFSSVRQLVTLPADAASIQLRWWHLYGTQEQPLAFAPAGVDRQELILLKPDETTRAVLSRVRRNDVNFIQEVTDLSAYRGESVYIYFNAFNDGNNARTWMYIDRVQLCISGAPPLQPFADQSVAPQFQGAVATTDPLYGQPTFYYPTAQAQDALPFATATPVMNQAPAVNTPPPVQSVASSTPDTFSNQPPPVETPTPEQGANAPEAQATIDEQAAQLAALQAAVDGTPDMTSGSDADPNTTRGRTTAVAVLCGIVLVVGLLAIGIIRVITRTDNAP